MNVYDFGAVGDGVADDTAAIQLAIDAAADPAYTASNDRRVCIPSGAYRITSPLVVHGGVLLDGDGVGPTGTRIIADTVAGDFNLTTKTGIPQVGGETVYCAIDLVGYDTGAAMTPARVTSDLSRVRDIRLDNSQCNGGAVPPGGPATMDGVRVMAHGAVLDGLYINGFPRNGISVLATVTAPAVNASRAQFRDIVLYGNGQDGIEIGGDDSNVLTLVNVSAVGNWRHGINDHSFLGCLFVGCHTEANRERNYSADRAGSPGFSSFVGCYAEQDAPSKFTGNVFIGGGCVAGISSDSSYDGYAPAGGGWRRLSVRQRTRPDVRDYPGTGSGYGVYIRDVGGLYTPGNGHMYRVVAAGRTWAAYRGEAPPVWPTTTGTVTEHDGLEWEHYGELVRDRCPFFTLGGSNGTEVAQWGYAESDGSVQGPYWVKALSGYTGAAGRLLTGLQGGVQTFATWETGYKDGPVGGQVMHPALWVGSYYYGERRVEVAYDGTPDAAAPGSGIPFFSPGDLILNAKQGGYPQKRVGPWAWVVDRMAARAQFDWSPGAHFALGNVVRPSTPNGYVYRAYAYVAGSPKQGLYCVTGAAEPSWPAAIGVTVDDGHITWIACVDLTADASPLQAIPVQADAHADSAAADVSALVSDFNALLAKLRAAGVIKA